MHDPPHSCLCLYAASDLRRFFWLALVNINVCTHFIKLFHIVKIYGYFHILASALSRSVETGILQAHWQDLVGINLCAKKNIKVFVRFQELWIFSLTVTFWPRYCLGQWKVPFGDSFVWILSTLICIQNYIKNSIWLKTCGDFHIFILFASALPWWKKNGIWRAYWLDCVVSISMQIH